MRRQIRPQPPGDAARAVAKLVSRASLADMSRLLPPWLVDETLDLSELAEFDVSVADARDQLEADLGCHVAAYRAGAKGREGGLCDVYQISPLSESELRRIREAEEMVRHIVFVAYAKPLTRRAPPLQRNITVGAYAIPRIGIGTLRLVGRAGFGWPPDAAASARVLSEAVTLGIRLIDTADAYGPGVAEELVASALHPYRADLVVATKGGIERRSRDEWMLNGRPEYLRTACEGSLRRLRVDALRLYQLHAVDPAVPIEESVGAMVDLQDEGKVEHIGLCNVSAEQYYRAKAIGTVASVQNRFNRNDESHREMVGICERDGVPLIAWGPLDGGRLVQHVPAEAALEWILSQSPALVPIPGAATVEEARGCASLISTPRVA